MKLPLPFWRRTPPAPPTPPRTQFLGAALCSPSVCAATRTGIDMRAAGGATWPLGEPDASQPLRWKRALSVPFQSRFMVTASAWDDESGEGNLVWRKRSRPRTTSSRRSRVSERASKVEDATGAAVASRRSLASRRAARSSSFRVFTFRALSTARVSRSQRRDESKKRVRNFRVELKRSSSKDSYSLSSDDTRVGNFAVTLVPQDRFVTSVTVKGLPLAGTEGRGLKMRRKERSRRSRKADSAVFKSDVEYRWQEKSFSVLTALEGFRAMVSLRVKTRPLRLTPRIQLPLVPDQKETPRVQWRHEPRSGVGEFEYSWGQYRVCANWPRTLVFAQKDKSGSSFSLSLDSRKVVKVDRTLVRPLQIGAVMTLNGNLSNEVAGNGFSASVVSSYGAMSAYGNADKSCGFGLEANIDSGRQAAVVGLRIENLREATLRLGFFY